MEPLGLPRGSVRALLALTIVGLFLGLIYIRGVAEAPPTVGPDATPVLPVDGRPIVPFTVMHLVFIVLASYFSSRGSTEVQRAEAAGTPAAGMKLPAPTGEAIAEAAAAAVEAATAKPPTEPRRPLFLPKGVVRTLLLVGCGAAAGIAVSSGTALEPSVLSALVLLGTFFGGVLIRGAKLKFLYRGSEKSAVLVTIEHVKAVVCLLATFALAGLYLTSQDSAADFETLELFLGMPAVFYFGSR